MSEKESVRLKFVILGIIAHTTLQPGHGSYIASWDIASALQRLGYEDISMATQIPQTIYDHTLRSLIEDGIIEELPELHYRYQLKRKEQ